MDAHLFRMFAKAALPLLTDARIDKIQEPAQGLLTLSLHGRGPRRQLFWSYRRAMPFCFLSESKLSAGKAPPAQIMRLRKYFSDRRIISAVPQFAQRRLWLLTAGREDSGPAVPWLCLDLVKGPSLHFLEADQAPQEDQPQWPAPEELGEACRNWRDWPVLTPSLRKHLNELDEPDRWAVMEDLRLGSGSLFLRLNESKRVTWAGAWPASGGKGGSMAEIFREDWLKGLERAGNDLILRRMHEEDQDRLLAPLRKKRERKLRILKKLEDDEKRLLLMAAREEDGRALRDCLWRHDSAGHLKELEAGGRKIALNDKYSLLENMERFFHEAKRGKRGLKALSERKAALLDEIALLENADAAAAGPLADSAAQKRPALSKAAALRASLPKNVGLFISSDGRAIFRGKDANGNRAVLRLAQGHDLWAHVETGQGAHVLIRRRFPGEELSYKTLSEAASLAAVKSWFKDAGSCSVMFAEARHVKPAKNGPPGKVVIDRLFKTELFKIDTEIERKLLDNENKGGLERRDL